MGTEWLILFLLNVSLSMKLNVSQLIEESILYTIEKTLKAQRKLTVLAR